MEYNKTFIVKKGQEDFRTWSRANDFIFNIMMKKRKQQYKHRVLRKDIEVTVKVKC